jgi:pyruvate-ferredoxin/flavodoxin oxidoreductase
MASGLAWDNHSSKKRDAVEAGYWHLYRYNPLLKEEGKNPFILDSKEPTASYRDFIWVRSGIHRLTRTFPEELKYLFEAGREGRKGTLRGIQEACQWLSADKNVI